MSRWLNKAKGEEKGAALVEFAIILPLLIVMLFGILEASWAFAQQNDVRHGTREAARLAAVNYGDVQAVAQEACARMDIVYPATAPQVTITPLSTDGVTGGLAQITISSTYQTITGMLDASSADSTSSRPSDSASSNPCPAKPTSTTRHSGVT